MTVAYAVVIDNRYVHPEEAARCVGLTETLEQAQKIRDYYMPWYPRIFLLDPVPEPPP